MSVATVKTHLTHIYAKTGITTRAELAAKFPAPEESPMEMVHEFTLHFVTGDQFPIARRTLGTRLVAAVNGGWAKGERINGRLVGPSADWLLIGPDGYAQIDVRTQLPHRRRRPVPPLHRITRR